MADSLHVGITGSRHPITIPQASALAGALAMLNATTAGVLITDGVLIMHHGLCTGADEAAHRIARTIGGWTIHGHPGHDMLGESDWRATSIEDDVDVMHHSRRYYLRNRDITEACSILVAAPLHPEDDPRSARSGTWATVRDARSRGREIVIVWPDGRAEKENGHE